MLDYDVPSRLELRMMTMATTIMMAMVSLNEKEKLRINTCLSRVIAALNCLIRFLSFAFASFLRTCAHNVVIHCGEDVVNGTYCCNANSDFWQFLVFNELP